MKVAALDLGSNTFLLLIAEVLKSSEGQYKITKAYSDSVEVVRLGQDVDKTKRLHPEALLRADACLGKFKKIIDQHQPDQVLAMATSAARDSENRNELFDIGKKYAIPIEVIPGSREAQITFQGSVSGQTENKSRLVVDIGGGSTEFILGNLSEIKSSKSLNIGCVRLTEKFISGFPVSIENEDVAQKFIEEQMGLLSQFEVHAVEEILAVAGTPTSLVQAQIGKFDPSVIDGYKLTLKTLEEWREKLKRSTIEEITGLGIPKGRADVIFIGVLILLEALKKFNKDFIIVSTRGVRHGIALEMGRRFLN